jgi:hypothetical protein
MSVAWIGGVERGTSDSPAKGTSDDPLEHYPIGDTPGRGHDRALLPHRRRLHPPRSRRRRALLLAQAALRFNPQAGGAPRPGASWARWDSFYVYGANLHVLCSTNRVPISCELTAASAADVLLVEELLYAARLRSESARKLLGNLAYRSESLKKVLAHRSVVLATERADRRPARRQQVEVCFAALKRVFGLGLPWRRRWWGSLPG